MSHSSDFATPNNSHQLAFDLLEKAKASGLTLATAESCTGGALATILTSIPGSSSVFLCSAITYSNESKMKILAVPEDVLKKYGAVSEETALHMLDGIRNLSGADINIAITGIAGPGGGSIHKPVGTVFISISTPQNKRVNKYHFAGSRQEIREQAVIQCLSNALNLI